MGIIQTIFFQPQRGYREYIKDSKISNDTGNLFRLDGVINEQHNSSATITKHPVEFGVNITEHVIRQPQKVVVYGVITNSPFIHQTFNRIPGAATTFTSQIGGAFMGSRARDAYAGLIKLQNKRLPVQLQTGLLVYNNMVLTDISAPNDLAGDLKVTLTFEEIFIVNNGTTGATQTVITNPGTLDLASAITTLVGLGIAGSMLAGFKGIDI